MLGFRIMKNELMTDVKYIFNQAIYESQINLRHPPIFNISRIPERSAIGQLMKTMNEYKTHINFELSPKAQRESLKKAFTIHRQNIEE